MAIESYFHWLLFSFNISLCGFFFSLSFFTFSYMKIILAHIFTVSILVSVISSKSFCHLCIYLFTLNYFWLCWVFVAARGLSLVAASRGYSLVSVPGLLIAMASLVAEIVLWSVQASVAVQGLSCPWACGIFQRRQWHPTPVLLPGKSHGRRSLVGCSPWSRYESDMTEWFHFHFSLSCVGEGNGNPLQRSWLESPRDGGAWWAAIYGVTKSWTRLKWLSSSSSSMWNLLGPGIELVSPALVGRFFTTGPLRSVLFPFY